MMTIGSTTIFTAVQRMRFKKEKIEEELLDDFVVLARRCLS